MCLQLAMKCVRPLWRRLQELIIVSARSVPSVSAVVELDRIFDAIESGRALSGHPEVRIEMLDPRMSQYFCVKEG